TRTDAALPRRRARSPRAAARAAPRRCRREPRGHPSAIGRCPAAARAAPLLLGWAPRRFPGRASGGAMRAIARVTVIALLSAGAAGYAAAQTPPMQPDIAAFKPPTAGFEYEKREVMIPMRDGVKLFTSIVIPKGAKNAPMILSRTPYNAAKRTERMVSPHILATLAQGDEVFAPQGYIRVI